MDITAIAIVAIICGAIVSLSKNRGPSKKNIALTDQMQADYEHLQTELKTMSERLAVLEKIVTDEKYQLNKELNALKD